MDDELKIVFEEDDEGGLPAHGLPQSPEPSPASSSQETSRVDDFDSALFAQVLAGSIMLSLIGVVFALPTGVLLAQILGLDQAFGPPLGFLLAALAPGLWIFLKSSSWRAQGLNLGGRPLLLAEPALGSASLALGAGLLAYYQLGGGVALAIGLGGAAGALGALFSLPFVGALYTLLYDRQHFAAALRHIVRQSLLTVCCAGALAGLICYLEGPQAWPLIPAFVFAAPLTALGWTPTQPVAFGTEIGLVGRFIGSFPFLEPIPPRPAEAEE